MYGTIYNTLFLHSFYSGPVVICMLFVFVLFFNLSLQDCCKVGIRGIERQVVLFEKLLLILKKKDVKKYTYKGHVLVRF